MKAFFITAAFSLFSVVASAQPIDLQAGSSIVINGEVITCLGTPADQLAPLCSIKQDGGYYRLYAGASIAESFNYFDQAMAGARKMKEAGLCR